MEKKNSVDIFILLLHVILGFVASVSPAFALLWNVVIVFSGLYFTYKNKNANNEALSWAAYYVGMEVLLRMCDGSFTYENGKYFVTFILIWGMIVEKRHAKIHVWISMIFLLLLPGIFQGIMTYGNEEKFRPLFFANISGMISLLAASLYCYNRKISITKITGILSYLLLPIISMSFTLFIRTPSLEEVYFSTKANFETSGGFSSNQVATVLGVGYAILFLFYLYKIQFTKYKLLDLGIMLFLIIRAILTFSRGGNFVAIAALIAFVMVNVYYKNTSLISGKFLFRLVIIGILITISTIYINNASKNMLSYRYTNKNNQGVEKDVNKYSGGRLEILDMEIELFYENIIWGAGVSGGNFDREKKYSLTTLSHNEFGRLLAEHGIFGLCIILILIRISLRKYLKSDIFNKGFFIFFFTISVLTMSHSAMRLVLPGYIFGLSLLILYQKDSTKTT